MTHEYWVDVLAVLDFQIPCFRPESPALYLRSLLSRPWTITRTPETNLGTGTTRERELQRSRTARRSTSWRALFYISTHKAFKNNKSWASRSLQRIDPVVLSKFRLRKSETDPRWNQSGEKDDPQNSRGISCCRRPKRTGCSELETTVDFYLGEDIEFIKEWNSYF